MLLKRIYLRYSQRKGGFLLEALFSIFLLALLSGGLFGVLISAFKFTSKSSLSLNSMILNTTWSKQEINDRFCALSKSSAGQSFYICKANGGEKNKIFLLE